MPPRLGDRPRRASVGNSNAPHALPGTIALGPSGFTSCPIGKDDALLLALTRRRDPAIARVDAQW